MAIGRYALSIRGPRIESEKPADLQSHCVGGNPFPNRGQMGDSFGEGIHLLQSERHFAILLCDKRYIFLPRNQWNRRNQFLFAAAAGAAGEWLGSDYGEAWQRGLQFVGGVVAVLAIVVLSIGGGLGMLLQAEEH